MRGKLLECVDMACKMVPSAMNPVERMLPQMVPNVSTKNPPRIGNKVPAMLNEACSVP
jgi:hypothetical protein